MYIKSDPSKLHTQPRNSTRDDELFQQDLLHSLQQFIHSIQLPEALIKTAAEHHLPVPHPHVHHLPLCQRLAAQPEVLHRDRVVAIRLAELVVNDPERTVAWLSIAIERILNRRPRR